MPNRFHSKNGDFKHVDVRFDGYTGPGFNSLRVHLGVKMKELIPLLQWNSERAESYQNLAQPKPNGLACPLCGEELIDTNPGIILISNPPQKEIHCSNCAYKGRRVD